MTFAAIYVPDFPVAAVVRMEPALRERPVAVLQGTAPVLTIAAMNEAAAEIGIEFGMTKLQAAAYPVEIRQRSPAQEAVAHAALLDCAQALSPRVEDTAPDTVVLDITGVERLFGPPEKLAAALRQRALLLGLEINVAVAANPDAAIHAARGFAGITVIPPGKHAQRLGELAVDVLQVAPEILATFDRWGVHNLRALAALPEVALVERLGQEGLRLQKLARGVVERPLVPAEPPLEFEESMELEYPVALLEPLAFILGRLLEQLCARLEARALATNELRLTLGLDIADEGDVSSSSFLVSREKPSSVEKQETRNEKHYCLRLPLPMLGARLFLKLLQLELRAHPPTAPVVKVTLSAEPVKARPGQGGLFLPATPAPDRLELTLARLAGIVGEQKIGAAEVLDAHRPDAFQMKRFAPTPAQSGHREIGPSAHLKEIHPITRSSDHPPMHSVTALRRFRPPLAAEVELRDGEPARIAAGEIRGAVASISGPWRTSGNWWKEKAPSARTDDYGSSWARDEWDIALRSKQGIALYRIYRELESNAWFVEGSYD